MLLKKDSFKISPAKRIAGSISISSDKSISHRSIIFASLASGSSVIKNFLMSEDCLNTLKIFKKLGVDIKTEKDGTLIIKGKGRYGLKGGGRLYCGNSATTMRLLSGILACQNFDSCLYGDSSLSNRPMKRIIIPLKKMGANISAKQDSYPPLKIRKGEIKGIFYQSPIASAQVKSCIFLAGLYSDNPTRVSEPFKSRDHTEKMMEYFKIPVKIEKDNSIMIKGGNNWPGMSLTIPGDFSSAAFFITAALLIPDSELEIKEVNLNSTRTGFLETVKKMGGNIKILRKKISCNELVGDIKISYSKLKSVQITDKDIPQMIDEIPLVALLATQAEGKTIIDGLSELRKKETDRLHAITTQLSIMGQSIQEEQNSLIIIGNSGSIKGAKINSFGDHRIAMMCIIGALVAKTSSEISSIKCIKTSFPDFFSVLTHLLQ